MRKFYVPLVAAMTAMFLMLGTMLAFATVQTDQPDYTPGSVVTISGDNSNGVGYLAGEAVSVEVSGPNGYQASCEGLADDNGAWSCQVTLSDSDLAVGEYTYTAMGQTSAVSESGTFTDSTVNTQIANFKADPNPLTLPGSTTISGQVQQQGNNNDTIAGLDVEVTHYSNSGCTTGLFRTDPLTTTSGGYFSEAYSPSATEYIKAHVADKTVGGVKYVGSYSSCVTLTVNPAAPSDTTPPVISYVLNPASPDGSNGWYKSNVTLTWTVTENESPGSLVKTGCVNQNITADQDATTYSCSATSDGGTATQVDVTIKRDATAPGITWSSGISNGDTFEFGSVPGAATCTATDGRSGPDTCTVTGYGTTVGPHTLTATAYDKAGNSKVETRSYTVGKASSTVTVTCTAGAPYTYTGSAQTPCTAEATGAGMGPVDVTDSLLYSDNIVVGTATADASWDGDANHEGSDGSTHFTIGQAATTTTVTCTAGPFTYNGLAHEPCSASVTGAGGLNQSLTVTYVNNTNAGTATASAAYAGTANYEGSDGSTHFTITKADATCLVFGYSGVYDAALHGASGSCTGVGGEDAGTLVLGATYKNVPGGNAHWAFTGNGNYDDENGDVAITITKADATCLVSGYDVVLDGNAHTATGSCSGVGGVDLTSLLDLSGTTHTAAGDYLADPWTFAGNGNYNSKSGTVNDRIHYNWTGFFQPVDNTLWNSAKAGQAIPVKFNLGGDQGLDIFRSGYPKITARACPGSSALVDPIEEYVTVTAGGSSLTYGMQQYVYVWKTQKTYAGKCFVFELGLKDGTSHTFNVQFK